MKIPEAKSGIVLRIYLSEKSHRNEHGHPLGEEIILRARDAGLAGATVFRGAMGYGAHHQLRTEKILELSTDLPEVIEIIDCKAKVDAFRESIQDLVAAHCVVTWPVEIWLPDSEE